MTAIKSRSWPNGMSLYAGLGGDAVGLQVNLWDARKAGKTDAVNLERFRQKQEPVLPKKARQSKMLEAFRDSSKNGKTLASQGDRGFAVEAEARRTRGAIQRREK